MPLSFVRWLAACSVVVWCGAPAAIFVAADTFTLAYLTGSQRRPGNLDYPRPGKIFVFKQNCQITLILLNVCGQASPYQAPFLWPSLRWTQISAGSAITSTFWWAKRTARRCPAFGRPQICGRKMWPATLVRRRLACTRAEWRPPSICRWFLMYVSQGLF